jgi:ethanolamine transporter EutH
MYNEGWGLSTWTMVLLGFLMGPAVAYFVADAVVIAHDWDESFVGVPVFLGMMALWLSSLFYLNDAIVDRQRQRFEQRQQARQQQRDE